MKHTSILQLTTALIAIAALHAASFADETTSAFGFGPTEDIKSGSATLMLDQNFINAMGSSNLSFTKIAPASYSPGKHKLTIPITGGVFDLKLAESDMITGGGIKLTNGNFIASFTDFIITLPDDHTKAEVSALYTNNGAYLGRIPLCTFDYATLNIPTPYTLPPNKKVVIHNVPFNLTANAAAALNAALSLPNVFHANDAVGVFEVTFKVAAKTL